MKKKYFIVSFIIIVVLCIIITPIALQNDTFYTIKIGDFIIHNGIDMLDHFSIHTLPYTYPHWLYDCLIYLIYSISGFTSLYIFNIVCFIGLIALIFYFNNKHAKSKFISLLFTIMSILTLSSYIATRAQVISYIIFILEYIFITNYLKKPNIKYLVGLVILSLLLCNMHVAVWPFYFIIYIPFILEYIIANILKKKTLFNFIEIDNNKYTKYLIITMFIAIIPGFLTPIKDTPFTYLLHTLQGDSQSFIQEHLPPAMPKKIVLIAFSFCTFVLSVIGKIKMHQLFLILGLTLMAFTSDRHIALYTIFIFPIFAILINNIFSKVKVDVDKYTLKYCFSKIGIAVIIIILGIITGISIYINKDKVFIEHDTYPVDATKYIKENLDYQNIRLLNEYNYGSYLLFNDIHVFIDSRADLYTKEFNGTRDILSDYMLKNYFQIINDYDITHVIAMKDEHLDNYMHNNGIGNLLYEDEYFTVYEIR